MFKPSTCSFPSEAVIEYAVDDSAFVWNNIRYFDNDGFQLSLLEQEYYKINGIWLKYINGVWGYQDEWMVGGDNRFIIDHSMIITRCGYVGEALEQLHKYSSKFPYLKKYTKLQPKWGIDFALEYTDGNDFLEVLHIEMDYATRAEAEDAKAHFEERFMATDWEHFTKYLQENKDTWSPLQGMDRNDWKARAWGLTKAECLLKVV